MKMGSPDAPNDEELEQDEGGYPPGLRHHIDIAELKYLLQEKVHAVGVPFNTNILRIALNF
jgi:hypothetical protein